MKRKGFVFIILLALTLITSCGNSHQEIILLNKDDSYFMDFTVNENLVYIECYLIVTNTGQDELEYSISADFTKDVRTGLLKESVLYACDEQTNKQIFILQPGATEKFYCTFIGEYAGIYQKHDRNLPEKITFHIN